MDGKLGGQAGDDRQDAQADEGRQETQPERSSDQAAGSLSPRLGGIARGSGDIRREPGSDPSQRGARTNRDTTMEGMTLADITARLPPRLSITDEYYQACALTSAVAKTC
jgi:hypothetical protein